MNAEKKKRNVGSKIAIVVIIAYLLLPLIMTLIYSLFQEWIDVMPTGFTLGAYAELFTDPLFWQAVDPERRVQMDALTDRYEEELYDALDGRLRLRSLDVYADANFGAETPQTLEDLGRGDVRFYIRVDPYGPYDERRDGDENVARFAADCWSVTQTILRQGPIPDRVSFSWQSPDETYGFDLDLSSRVQLDWTADQMAEQTRVWATETFDGVENMDSHLDEMLPRASSEAL